MNMVQYALMKDTKVEDLFFSALHSPSDNEALGAQTELAKCVNASRSYDLKVLMGCRRTCVSKGISRQMYRMTHKWNMRGEHLSSLYCSLREVLRFDFILVLRIADGGRSLRCVGNTKRMLGEA